MTFNADLIQEFNENPLDYQGAINRQPSYLNIPKIEIINSNEEEGLAVVEERGSESY